MNYKALAGLTLASTLLLGACGGETSEKKEETKTENKTEKKAEKKDDALKIGDTKKVGDITYTLNSVKKTDETNEFNEVKPQQVIQIEYSVKSEAEDDYPLGSDAKVYVNGKQAEDYPLGSDKTGTISKGREGVGSQSFSIPKDAKEIEIEFAPLTSLDSEKALYKVEIK